MVLCGETPARPQPRNFKGGSCAHIANIDENSSGPPLLTTATISVPEAKAAPRAPIHSLDVTKLC